MPTPTLDKHLISHGTLGLTLMRRQPKFQPTFVSLLCFCTLLEDSSVIFLCNELSVNMDMGAASEM